MTCPKQYTSKNKYDVDTIQFHITTYEKYFGKTVKVIPSVTGFNSFKELEKYNGHVGKVRDITFTVNGKGEYIYITGCPLPISAKFLEIL